MRKELIYHLIPADFENYNVDNLLTDKKISTSQGISGIPWKNGGIDGKNAQDFQEEDIVYVYFHNLTGEQSHILLRGKVTKIEDYYIDPQDGFRYKVFYLGSIKYYKNISFTYNKLKAYGVNITQTKIYLGTDQDYYYYIRNNKIDHGYRNRTKEEYEKFLQLISELEQEEKSSDLISLKEHYNKPCEICRANDKTHTFIKENGLYYYEVHHILEQNILRKKEIPHWYKNFKDNDLNNNGNNLVYADFNVTNLCPVCHRKIMAIA